MKLIYVKPVNTCNLNCAHCFTSGRNGDRSKWDVDSVIGWIDDYRDRLERQVPVHIELHGGEPFLVPVEEIKDFCTRIMTDDRVTVSATTNLVYPLTEAHLSLFENEFNGRVGTSWDSDIRFETDTQRRRWERNVKVIRERGIDIVLMISISRDLIERGPDYLIDQLDGFNVSEVRLERLTHDGNAAIAAGLFPDNEKQDKYLLDLYLRYREKPRTYSIVTFDTIESRLKSGIVKADTNCRNCEQNLVTVSADGSLSGCPNAAAAKPHAKIDDGVDVFLTSDGRLNEIASELSPDARCLRCDLYDVCGGDCHRLPWTGNRCGGMKLLLRHLTGRNAIPITNLK